MINRRNLHLIQYLGPLLRIYFFKTKCTKGITISWVSLYQIEKHLVRASNNVVSFWNIYPNKNWIYARQKVIADLFSKRTRSVIKGINKKN